MFVTQDLAVESHARPVPGCPLVPEQIFSSKQLDAVCFGVEFYTFSGHYSFFSQHQDVGPGVWMPQWHRDNF